MKGALHHNWENAQLREKLSAVMAKSCWITSKIQCVCVDVCDECDFEEEAAPKHKKV